MIGNGRYTRTRLAASDDDSMLERDVLLNLVVVFLVLIGAPAMVTAAQAAAEGAAKADEPAATVYVASDATLRLDEPDGAAQPLESIAAALEARLKESPSTGPIVLCHAPDVPADQLFYVLRRINGIPNVKTFLALQKSPSR